MDDSTAAGDAVNSGENVDQEQIEQQEPLPDWGEVQRGGEAADAGANDPGTVDGQVQAGPRAEQEHGE